MSLGWLTESSLIPKAAKPIEGVSTASLINLQAVVFEREQRGPLALAKRRRAMEEASRNEGVDARRAKDEQAVAAAESGDLVQKKLLEKARRYEAMVAGREAAGEALVDFSRKRALGLEAPAALEPEEDVEPAESAAGTGAAVPPPPCLGGSSAAASSAAFPSAPERRGPAVTAAARAVEAAKARAQGAILQAFERTSAAAEDLEHMDRLHEETELLRQTEGRQRREARDAIRSRLAALRAAKAAAAT